MTNEEVIEFLHRMKKNAEEEKKTYEDMLIPHALGMVINDAYDDMVEICNLSIEALKKQIPKKPNITSMKLIGGEILTHYNVCPICDEVVMRGYPCKCGQLIDWSE